jgi:chromosome segregation ATPase
MESGFSQVQEKLRGSEHAQQATRLELATWRTDSEAAIQQINQQITEIRTDLEINRKDHETFNHELNASRLHLERFEAATQLEMKAAGENHAGLQDAHQRLASQVEEQNVINRDVQTKLGKELRELANQADDIRRNLEMLETEVRRNESSRKNNETSINNKLEGLTLKQGEHTELLEGLAAKLARDEEKVHNNQLAFEAEVKLLREKSEHLVEELDKRTEVTQGMMERMRSSLDKEIASQCLVVKELCRSGNEELRYEQVIQ